MNDFGIKITIWRTFCTPELGGISPADIITRACGEKLEVTILY